MIDECVRSFHVRDITGVVWVPTVGSWAVAISAGTAFVKRPRSTHSDQRSANSNQMKTATKSLSRDAHG